MEIFILVLFIFFVFFVLIKERDKNSDWSHFSAPMDQEDKYPDQSDFNTPMDEEERKRKTLFLLGYNNIINHDGNPNNDTLFSQHIPLTDAWKEKRRW